MKPLYKSMMLLMSATATLSSCEDFLTCDSEDSYTLSGYLTSEDQLINYTFQLYGPKTWNEFDDKFSWCVGEVYSGNIYHNYGDEGQFHFMNFTNNNANILNGYTSLYGVIARANMIINDVPAICKENGISQKNIDRAVGEAKMYRGMAYFLLAEYFGASPIVLNNTANITNGTAFNIPKADRKSLYTLIEKDWTDAYKLLPENPWGKKLERVTKWAAAGMLTKLYVTMASCQREIKGVNNYKCPDPNKYYNLALEYGRSVIKNCGSYMEQGYENYDKMFWPENYSQEILFGLRFERGDYGMGCSRQIQFARSKFLAHETNAYGGEKGLTTNLFNSFEEGDIRKKACSYFNPLDFAPLYCSDADFYTKYGSKDNRDYVYNLADGSTYYYYLNPNKASFTSPYGNEPNSVVFNHCRKFIYRTPTTNEFSAPLTIPFLRVADVYLLCAEAEMGKVAKVSEETSAGTEYLNVVRKRAGLNDKSSVAFYTPDTKRENGLEAIGTANDENGNPVSIKASANVFDFQYDLISERRWEFALENQCWLDIKRLYYRDETAAKNYIEEQDRGYIFGEAYGSTVKVKDSKKHYMRQSLIYELSKQAHEINAKSYSLQTEEKTIAYENIQWFLPVPSAVALSGGVANGTAQDVSKRISDGSYEY